MSARATWSALPPAWSVLKLVRHAGNHVALERPLGTPGSRRKTGRAQRCLAEGSTLLLLRRVIAQAPASFERGESFGLSDPHLDFAVLAVALPVRGRVGQHVLVAQLDGDLFSDGGQLAEL